MKKIYSIFLAIIFSSSFAIAQTTAMDFTMNDCNGNMHNLFSELDSQNVVIMEFFHTCPSCAAAANDIKPMYNKLKGKYGNKVRFFITPEDDTYSCSSVLNWASTNGVASIVVPFDSGGVQTAYYGGMGMPTIAIAAGSTHKILYLANQTVSYMPGDTAIMAVAIRGFLDSVLAGVPNIKNITAVNISPNPIRESFTLSLDSKESGLLSIAILSVTGQKLIDLTDEKIQTGNWSKNYSLSLPSGIYFLQGSLNGKNFQEKITIQH